MTKMHRGLLAAFVLLIAITIGLPFGTSFMGAGQIVSPTPAQAQQAKKKKRRSLFSVLFGRRDARKKAVVKKSKRRVRKSTRKNRKKRRTRSASKRRSVAKAVKAAAAKAEDAKTVLVVGDFLAGALADGLEVAFAQKPGVKVTDKSKGLSGFVRNDLTDWPTALAPLLESEKPAYIVAMLGTNDRQQIRAGGKRLKRRAPEWDAAYKERVAALGKALKDSGIPYTWVGLPPVRFKNMNKDFLVFNEWYGAAAASESGGFVDIWDGYSDAEGNYSRSGPDVNGQIVLLRPKGGINMTKAGKRRLAFYVESTILKTIGLDGSGEPSILAGAGVAPTAQPATPEYDPAKTGKTIVINLDDPSADGGEVLAGKSATPVRKPAARQVPIINASSTPLSNDASTARAGRVDNFAWPPTNAIPQPTTSTAAVTN